MAERRFWIRIGWIVILLVAGFGDRFSVSLAQGLCGDYYVILPNDTLSEIAELCGTTVEAILRLNPEITDPANIYVGQIIRIPLVEQANPPIIAFSPGCGLPGTTLQLLGSGFPSNVNVTINGGEQNKPASLSATTTSDSYGRIITSLLIPSNAVPGTSWTFTAEARIGNARFNAFSSEFHLIAPAVNPNDATTYTVQEGDTLAILAERFNRTTESLLNANPQLVEATRLVEGQVIYIPPQERGRPIVEIQPICGPPNTILQASGRGFTPGSELRLQVGLYLTSYQFTSVAQVNPDRSFLATVEIPDTAKPQELWIVIAEPENGQSLRSFSNIFTVTPPINPNDPAYYVVKAGDTLNEIATNYNRSIAAILNANPQLTNPNQLNIGERLIIPPQNETIVISPSSGVPGTQLQIAGFGFSLNSPIILGIGRKDGTYNLLGTFTTDGSGIFRTQTTIPQSARPGEIWVVVSFESTDTGSKPKIISNDFTIARPLPPLKPRVSIWPFSGPPGSKISVVGYNFPPRMQVQFGIGRPTSEPEVILTSWTEINGTVAAEINVPEVASVGANLVITIKTVSEPIIEISSPVFVVVQEGAPSVTSVALYFVEEGKGAIGCGDAIVPIEWGIPTTQAPLVAAIRELLSLKTRTLPNTSFTNALYRSNLVIQSIEVFSGKAIIRLVGELIVAESCDYPRVQNQIEQTALQFPDISSVDILINDVPIEELEIIQP